MVNQSDSFQEVIIRKKVIIGGIAILWGLIILFFGFADVFWNHYKWIDSRHIRNLVNITYDDGLTNWFSSVQLLAVSIVLWMVLFVLVCSKPSLIRKKREKLGWGLGALFFTYLAVDDGSRMHERVGSAFHYSLDARHEYNPGFITNLFDIFPSYSWQFVYLPIFGVIAAIMLLFLIKNLKTKIQILFIFLGFFCYASSVGLDFFDGLNEKAYDPIIAYFNSDFDTIVHFSRLIEELFEMIGNTFFMLAFTKQLLNLADNWKVKLVDSSAFQEEE